MRKLIILFGLISFVWVASDHLDAYYLLYVQLNLGLSPFVWVSLFLSWFYIFLLLLLQKKKKKKNVIIQAIIVSHSRGADYFLMRIPSGKECLTICGAFWNWNEHINWCQERVFLGVYTNIAHDALILMVLSYLLKAERMTLRCFREVFIHACLWVRKGLKVKRAVWCRQ